MELYDRAEQLLGAILRRTCAVLLAILVAVPTVNIINRWISVITMAWYEEIMTLCFSWMIFLGAAELWRVKEMFNVDFFTQLVNNKSLLKALHLLVSGISLVLFTVLLFFGSKWIGSIHSTTAALSMPTGVLYASIPVSMALMLVMTLRDIAGDVAALSKG